MNTYYVGNIPFNGENSISHHGVKGQKWGIRRYQNPDGTLTEEGKRRYGTLENAKNQLALERVKHGNRIDKFHAARVVNPFLNITKKQREKTQKALETARKSSSKVEKLQRKADASERVWMKDKYKEEIKRGKRLEKAGYDPDADAEAMRRWGESLDRELESHPYSIEKGQDFWESWEDQALTADYQAAKNAQEQRHTDYYLYKKWGID